MDEKDLNALVARVGEEAAKKIKTAMEDAQKALDIKLTDAFKNNASKEEVKGIIDKSIEGLNAIHDEAALKNEEILKKQGEEIGALKIAIKASNDNKPRTFRDAIMGALEDKKSEIDAIVASKGRGSQPAIVLEVDKAAVVMSDASTIGAGVTQYTLTQNTGIISAIRRRIERYLQSVSVGTIASPRALWIEETGPQGTAAFIAEGAGKIQLSTLYVERTASVQKIAVFGKVTLELLNDLPQLVSYIEAYLMKQLTVTTENQLFNGDNTGNNLNGAINLATAFSAGANAGLLQAPNEFEVLSALALQVEVANGIANAVYIHPSTWAKMKALKNKNDTPIWKDYVDTLGDVVIDGMKIITTTAVTAGNFIGGDMTVLRVLYLDQLNIQIGLDGNDFTNNMKTILVEQRLVQFASANDTPCLVKGDFASAKTALAAA